MNRFWPFLVLFLVLVTGCISTTIPVQDLTGKTTITRVGDKGAYDMISHKVKD